jgi:RNA polymerase sigma factor (sigma-70 family)
MNNVIRHLRRASLLHDGSLTDGQLLERFLARRDEAAFEALLRRHGPMVLGVCRRVLQNEPDAEDAFQATFLVLVRKAATLQARELVGHWLYGVAYRTAQKARAMAARRRVREERARDRACPARPGGEPWGELLPLLDQELNRLPERYRVPIVLCDLEGGTRKEVARRLGLPEGTLSSRLAMARKLLRKRLARHDPAVSGGALAVLAHGGAPACAPHLLVTTAKGAVQAAAGNLAAGTVPARVVTLTEGVLKTMFLSRLKMTAVVLVVLGIAALGMGATAFRSLPTGQAETRETDPFARTETPIPEAQTKPQDDPPPAADREPARNDAVQGSGKDATKDIEAADFTSVEVGQAFQVDITRGDKFRVTVTADDNVLPLIKADKKGSTLRIHLDSGGGSIQVKTLKVAITMPALEGVNASGASRVTFKGFKGKGTFTAEASGASNLEGEIEAGKIDVEASGASRVSLKGAAKEAKLSATGGSNLEGKIEAGKADVSASGGSKVSLKGAAKEGKLSASGGGRLQLADFALDSAEVNLSGASKAEVQAKTKLDYVLSGASHLEYQGDPTVGKHEASGVSHTSQKKQ